MKITRIHLRNGTEAVLVRLSRHRPVYSRALGQSVPYAVQIMDEQRNVVAFCNLDGDPVELGAVPLGPVTEAPDDIGAVFNKWGQRRYEKMGAK